MAGPRTRGCRPTRQRPAAPDLIARTRHESTIRPTPANTRRRAKDAPDETPRHARRAVHSPPRACRGPPLPHRPRPRSRLTPARRSRLRGRPCRGLRRRVLLALLPAARHVAEDSTRRTRPLPRPGDRLRGTRSCSAGQAAARRTLRSRSPTRRPRQRPARSRSIPTGALLLLRTRQTSRKAPRQTSGTHSLSKGRWRVALTAQLNDAHPRRLHSLR
jgi:hypothetical protein